MAGSAGFQFRPEVTGVVESPLIQIATIAESMPGSLKLCYGESDTPTPEFICRAADEAARAGHTFYTHTAGYPELRQAIAHKVFDLHGVTYRPSEVMSTVGASMAIFAAIRACVGPGDNAVVISPTYAIFSNAVLMTGAEPREVPLARNGTRFTLDLDRVRRAIDLRTRMVIVNSPGNPTGWIATPDEQAALCELAERHDLMLLADEVYDRLVYHAEIARSFAAVAGNNERLVVVNSFSKTYNMTGWRLGWAQSSEPMIRLMSKAAEFMSSSAAAMVQQAGIVALRDGEPFVRDLRARYAERRAEVVETVSSIPGVSLSEPDGAFFGFMQIAGLTDSTAFAERLVRETGVALAPGAAFGAGGEGYLRICFASSVLTEALRRLAEFMERRNGGMEEWMKGDVIPHER